MTRLLLAPLMMFSLLAASQTMENVIPLKPAYPRLLIDENAYAYYHKDWRRLEDKLINHQKKTGNQLVIVTISSLHGKAIENMAVQIFRSWGIGDKEANNGLLILISRKEKKIKIETGYGLEGLVTDLESGVIISNILEPGFAKFDFQLPPARKDKGYLPALEKTIDTLINLTAEVNKKAIKSAAAQKKNGIRKKRNSLIIYLTAAVAFLFLAKKGWRLLNNKLSPK